MARSARHSCRRLHHSSVENERDLEGMELSGYAAVACGIVHRGSISLAVDVRFITPIAVADRPLAVARGQTSRCDARRACGGQLCSPHSKSQLPATCAGNAVAAAPARNRFAILHRRRPGCLRCIHRPRVGDVQRQDRRRRSRARNEFRPASTAIGFLPHRKEPRTE